MTSVFLVRIRLLSVACLLLGAVLFVRLYLVQLVFGSEYLLKADRQYAPAGGELWSRGSIFFTDKNGGKVSAATLRSGFTVAILPKAVSQPEKLASSLSSLLPLTREEIIAKSSKKDDPYEELARQVSPRVAEQIQAKKLSGVSLYKEQWRFYPGGQLAAHTLGFVGFDGDVQDGRYGLERYYEDILARRRGGLYKNFFAEIFSDVKRVATGAANFEGDIVTSIEPSVERLLEETVGQAQEKYSADRAGGIIMDPQTGRVFGMALSPSFDPNTYGNENDQMVFDNALVSSVYEMGSIIKPLTIAAALDARVITATSTYLDLGFLTLNGKTIYNFDGKGRGRVSMQEVLNQSLNTGAATAALRLGQEEFRGYFSRLGLGEETGIDLPGEEAGLVKNLESGRDIEIATASYGQGIALTPIQTTRALAALANGGFLITPHLVTAVEYSLGAERKIDESERIAVLRPETSAEITRILVMVVDTALLGGAYKMPRYSIAAKTGTALIAKPGGGGYYDDRFLHSFFGYFPAYNPRFIVFLYMLEPKGVAFAAHTLTEPFMNIAKFLINYYEIAPDR